MSCVQNGYLTWVKFPKKCTGSVWDFCFTIFIKVVTKYQKAKETGFLQLLSRRRKGGKSVLILFYILLLPQNLLSGQHGLGQQMAIGMLTLNELVISSSIDTKNP